ncbi:MAG: hypothetical protein ACR2FU_24465 [Streptosporangiaceae bacterium]
MSRTRSGEIVLHDEDEFAEHQARYAYPAEVITMAEQAAAWLRTALDGGEPSASAFRGYLAAILAQDSRS